MSLRDLILIEIPDQHDHAVLDEAGLARVLAEDDPGLIIVAPEPERGAS